VILGDCNDKVSEIADGIPRGALTLAFIDPTGLHAYFETVATLSERGRVDLLLLFADAYDIVRNVELYKENPQSNLDRVLGPHSNWRSKWDALDTWESGKVRRMFAGIYKEQLRRHLGYKVFGEYTIRRAKGALYRLIYASKHERGLEFWDKITRKDKGGQRHLFQ
jgi:three-Cys-motif partner protein